MGVYHRDELVCADDDVNQVDVFPANLVKPFLSGLQLAIRYCLHAISPDFAGLAGADRAEHVSRCCPPLAGEIESRVSVPRTRRA